MQCLNVNHPDILEFLEVKLDKGELNNANISIVMNIDSEEFANKVKNDEDIELEFNGLKTGETVSAKWLWNKLIENAYNSGDPGILNGYFANKMNNISYYESLISTNPCGEIWLGAYDCCCLGNLVLPRFVVDGKFDWDQFDETVRVGVRFLDNVLTINDFPLPEIKEKCHYNRRVGLGVMGLHTMLLELGLTYGSEEGLAFIDKLFHIMKNTSYDESITLAAEKGPFPGYRPDFLKSNFVKGLKPALRNKIKHHGIRNCALLTVPPTGTTSMVSGNGVSSGIESLFAPAYYRRVRASDEMGRDYYYQELVITDEYKKFGELAVGAYDITLDDHLKTQAVIQKHMDNAVSKTINIPVEFPMEDLKDKLLEYLPHVKGMTIYRQGSKGLEPLEHIPVDKVKELLAEEHAKGNIEDQSIMDCVSGVCTI
jgi:ribonucleoside-diphosphate reductase alpha chain